MNPTISPRHSEAAFRRYERWIADATNKWPEVVAFDPTTLGLSPTTVEARLRDAMAGYFQCAYKSDLLSWDRFCSLYTFMAVVQRNGKVLVGPRDKMRTATVATASGATASGANTTLTVTNPPERVLSALCVLLDARILTQPVRLVNPDKTVLDRLVKQHDVAVTPLPDGTTLLI